MTGRPLTTGQTIALGTSATAMLGIGVLGAYGTFTNLCGVFPGATALGAVAAGEGATLILALVYVGLTMLGQSSPAAVRLGLWALPALASGTGAVAAHGVTATIVYAVTPLAMCTAAEGSGLLARRIVIRTTGVDAEARRRTAAAVRALAYEQARAQRHPDEKVRARAERRAWRLARQVGEGDTELGEQLVDVQRIRLTEGADTALRDMFAPAVTPDRDAVTTTVPPQLPPMPEADIEQQPEPERVTPDTDPDTQASGPVPPADYLAELAVVAGVPTPAPGETLTGEQLVVVLRWLRYRDEPPLSYRQAVGAFRDAAFIGSEERVRKAWADLMSREEDGPAAPASR